MEIFRKIYLTRNDAEDAAAKYAEIHEARRGRMSQIESDTSPDESERFTLAVGSWSGELPAVAVDKGRDTIALFGWWCKDDADFVTGFLERQDADGNFAVTKVEWYEHFGMNENEDTFIFAAFRWASGANEGLSAALINPRRNTCWTLADWQLERIPINLSECECFSWRDFENSADVSGDTILAEVSER